MKVSVVILTYNQEKTIARTIDSVMSQICNFEFQVVIGEDDSSNDNTREVCELYAQKYKNIKLMSKAPNKGLMKNYADCLNECTGEYIAVCAGDDWWHNTNKLQMQVDYLDSQSDCVLCYTNYDIFVAKSGKIKSNSLPVESLDTTNIIDKLIKGFFLPPLTVMYRREMLKYMSVEEFAKRGYMAEDLPMYLEMALHGRFHCINSTTATYTVESGSISQFNSSRKMERFMLNMRDIKLDFISANKSVTDIKPQDIIELYDRIIFNYAFSFCDEDMIRKYQLKVVNLSQLQKVKLIISKIKPLMWILRKYKNR